MSASLAAVATALETYAGASTSANPNESGYWKRIAAASETLSGAGTVANEHAIGYMLRTSLALESIAGTDGAEENANESGYMKRIVDALEIQAGGTSTGSLMGRLVIAAENATFETEPVDHVVDGGFNDPAEWGTTQFTVADGVGTFATTLTRTVANVNGLPAIVGHTYRCTIDITEYTSGTGLRMQMGSASGPSIGGLATVGTHIEDVVAVSTVGPRLIAQGATSLKVDNYSVIDLDA